MEMNEIELTPEQKGVLASLSEETGEPVDTLIDKALAALQAHMRARRVHETANGSKNTQGAACQGAAERDKPIWEKFIEASRDIPDEELDRLPADLASQVDHYVYGTPKR
jgi:hypothetical protein